MSSTHVDIPELAALLEQADHVDVHTTYSNVGLRTFVAGFLFHRPPWLKLLFTVRAGLGRLVSRSHQPVPTTSLLTAEQISFTPGARVWFFTVVAAAEERFILLESAESHLTAWLCLTVDAVADNRNRFDAITIVEYHRWTGRLYFNLIRPFHHIVLRGMVKTGGRAG